MTRYEHTGGAKATTLSVDLGGLGTDLTIHGTDLSGWPSGGVGNFWAVMGRGTLLEEKVKCSVRSGTVGGTLTVVTAGRGQDGTTTQVHLAGTTLEHCWTALEADEANAHINATTAVHGLAGAVVGTSDSQTLTGKTLSSPVISGSVSGAATYTGPILITPVTTDGTFLGPTLVSPEERWSVSATAPTGTVNIDEATAGAWYFTSNAAATFTLNFRGSGAITLNSRLAVGDSVTITVAVTNGVTPFYPTAITVDGVSVTPKWQYGAAPTAGSASAIDVYTYTILKTASTPTYVVFASVAKFA